MPWYFLTLIIVGALALVLTLSAVFYKSFFKRFYDVVLSFLALLVLSPLFLILIVVGTVVLKGNPFFTQIRPGKKDKKTGEEKLFRIIKFRTMSFACDEAGNLLPDEDRLGGYGKLLRALSLDELPSLVNVLIGDLSLVGPRPQLVKDMVFMTESARNRHNVTPGITGLAQCNGRNAVSWDTKLDYDLKYVANVSFFGDIGILIKTVFKVLKREGITEEGKATAEDYGDYLLRVERITKEEYDQKQNVAKTILAGRS